VARYLILKKSNCPLLLKAIEKLDYGIIQDFNNKRNIEEMVFEIHNEVFIRSLQKTYINSIYDNLHNNINDNIYQILMGIGKTSTITPILVLHYFFNMKTYYISGNINHNINIVLPEHLVSDSYNIMLNYNNI